MKLRFYNSFPFIKVVNTKEKTTHFNIDFGNGPEKVPYEYLHNLPEGKKKHLLKNKRSCTSFEGELDKWNLKNMYSMQDVIDDFCNRLKNIPSLSKNELQEVFRNTQLNQIPKIDTSSISREDLQIMFGACNK